VYPGIWTNPPFPLTLDTVEKLQAGRESVMAEPSFSVSFLRGFTRVMLVLVLVAVTYAVFDLFPDIQFLPWCYVALGLVYLSWFIYEYSRPRLDVSSFVVPLLLMAGIFMLYWFIDAVIQIKEARPRIVVANDLKQIGMALRIYHDKFGSFPPAAVHDADGKPLYSWRVLLLPFLEQEALYARFHLDEPWDSPHNLTLLSPAPRPFRPPTDIVSADPSLTYYQVFVGPGAAFEGDKGLKIPDDFPDGIQNTILVVEAREPVPWSKPADIPYAANLPLPEFGALRRKRMGPLQWGEYKPAGFTAALADGSFRWFGPDMPPDGLRGWITRNGGEIPVDK
jgi:hypothetical protein